ncbi:MAG: class I SAM-dependent RNA methyltransferase [Angustibacter sp.]
MRPDPPAGDPPAADAPAGDPLVDDPAVGTILEVEVGPVAHGGHCVARYQGRVVFVRHALPGERVRARVTEGRPGDRFLRADAVEIVHASTDRVQRRCEVSGPGGCGGCDWQHAQLDAQRRMKADVIREQFRRLADLEVAVTVEPVAGDRDGLGWRTRVRHAVAPSGRLGLREYRSHRVVEVDGCPIAEPRIHDVERATPCWTGARAVTAIAPSGGERPLVIVETIAGLRTRPPSVPGADVVVQDAVAEDPAVREPAVREPAVRKGQTHHPAHPGGRRGVRERVEVPGWPEREFRVTGTGFWQPHRGAAATLVGAVLDALEPRSGERALDLYAGVGLFAAFLGEAVGERGQVLAVEEDRRAVRDARRSVHDLPHVQLLAERADRALAALLAESPAEPPAQGTDVRRTLLPDQSPIGQLPSDQPPSDRLPSDQPLVGRRGLDIVVLDPPRKGAGPRVVDRLVALAPRAIAYVACDPASLARDVARFTADGYRLSDVRGFDCFPMTHHVECVALLVPTVAESS